MKEEKIKEELKKSGELTRVGNDFLITRVVTRHFISDFFQGIRNLFGLRLRSYERVIKMGYEELINEMRLLYSDEVEWYRISINPMVNGSIMLNLYGALKK